MYYYNGIFTPNNSLKRPFFQNEKDKRLRVQAPNRYPLKLTYATFGAKSSSYFAKTSTALLLSKNLNMGLREKENKRKKSKGARKRKMSEDEEFFGMEKVDTYFGTWDGKGDWNTYTGDRNE